MRPRVQTATAPRVQGADEATGRVFEDLLGVEGEGKRPREDQREKEHFIGGSVVFARVNEALLKGLRDELTDGKPAKGLWHITGSSALRQRLWRWYTAAFVVSRRRAKQTSPLEDAILASARKAHLARCLLGQGVQARFGKRRVGAVGNGNGTYLGEFQSQCLILKSILIILIEAKNKQQNCAPGVRGCTTRIHAHTQLPGCAATYSYDSQHHASTRSDCRVGGR